MRSNLSLRSVLFGTAALVTALGANAASATITLNTYTQDKGSVTGTIVWDVPNSRSDYSVSTAVGRFTLNITDSATGTTSNVQSYCIDILQSIAKGSYGSGSLTSYLSSYGSWTQTKADQLNALIANGNSLVVDAKTSAAMQLAVWEIVYDYGTINDYSLSNGEFYTTGAMSGARDLATNYVTNVTSGIWKTDTSYTLSVLTSDKLQDQLVFTKTAPAAVPEPATWAMMIVGFGAVGGALRRRKPTMAVNFG